MRRPRVPPTLTGEELRRAADDTVDDVNLALRKRGLEHEGVAERLSRTTRGPAPSTSGSATVAGSSATGHTRAP
jgi:hypothetical protein